MTNRTATTKRIASRKRFARAQRVRVHRVDPKLPLVFEGRPLRHQGELVTDEVAERLASVVLGDVGSLTPKEAKRKARASADSLDRMLGRPKVGGHAPGGGSSPVIRARVDEPMRAFIRAMGRSLQITESEVIRRALSEYRDRHGQHR